MLGDFLSQLLLMTQMAGWVTLAPSSISGDLRSIFLSVNTHFQGKKSHSTKMTEKLFSLLFEVATDNRLIILNANHLSPEF